MRATKVGVGKKVLVGFSGGLSSRVLLHHICAFHAVDPRKNRKFSGLTICHVDQRAIVGGENHTETLRSIVESYGHSLAVIPLEDIFGDDSRTFVQTQSGNEDTLSLHVKGVTSSAGSKVEKLQRCFTSIGKLSSKEDLLHYLTMQLLYETARSTQCSAVILGDNSTRVAIRVMTQISKGRGFSMPLDVASESTWLPDLMLLRPLRDVDSKEIALCNQYENLKSVHVPNLTTGMPVKSSIDRLTEDFITGLQRDFPSTVSTVARTAFKTPTRWNAEGVERCALCNGPIPPDAINWRSRHTVSSFSTSTTTSTTSPPPTDATCSTDCGITGSCCSPTPTSSDPFDLALHLCYGCQNFIRDARDEAELVKKRGGEVVPVTLPGYVGETVDKARGREWMRKEIGEFLVEDDE
ncbi:Cytoplasmic tRNA 2-thiolation protein 2 [Rhizophlyctis rosea]|uniref:Cytoplasmic tRNA 2-thiolation protein 2 n=1 Tax=Rhizophlyctis rosea TaxID=64517 RepID=A0AAD5X5H4_9FUNG|nr:Cytoplasmic tRNA 2-thiolation protein 2 [Rhizophlyctis rosea]